MTIAERRVRAHQLRVLLACGERGQVLQQLFGVSPRTIKRLVRTTAIAVPSGRTPGPARGWLGRERLVVEQMLQRWVDEGLDALLAGDAPLWLHDLARRAGVPGAAAIAAMVQRIAVHDDATAEPSGAQALAHVTVCARCQTPRVSVRRDGVHRRTAFCCPTPGCRTPSEPAARIHRLDDWRRRRRQEESR
jgi:hypothetical protein